MDTTNSGARQSEELDQHWVEKLFPPHFTFQDLLEGKSKTTEEPRIVLPDRTESRRQIYIDVLREVQEKEEKIRRSSLAKRMSRDEQPIAADVEKKDSCEMLKPDCPGQINSREKCIWNEKDISTLRAALTELERDRWRLQQRLRSSDEQLKSEREERRRLQELLEEREEQLDCTRKEAARHALVVKALKMKVYQKDVQLQKLAKQSQEKAEEADGLRAELRRTRDGYRQIKQEHSDLAWELEKVKAQQKMEEARRVEDTRLEYQASTERLQKEVEEARNELRAEKERHGRSLTALELLRHHYNHQ
ncbi:coiled-coil domain-containing protein 160 homolog [Colossoma macropomum]|uniref:coiled-coil domain-containing protein 160 homolog n=1 Tax=Colossoma macropomum TaxID=42526 RepID=UPI001863FDB0|nr:coiled-coil domain-containing protein 160 homolog [Colossoma macropomum]